MLRVSLMWTVYLGCVIAAVSASATSFKEGQPCTTPNKARGECIRFKQCDSLLKIIQRNPLYDDDITFLKESQCGYDKEPLVCCPDSLARLPEPDVTEHVVTVDVEHVVTVDVEPVVTVEPEATDEPEIPHDSFTVLSDLLPTAAICKVKMGKRIIGGKKAKEDDFPWMALLEYKKPNNKKGFHCGGVLISERYVLTAAHCMAAPDMKKLKWVLSSVRLGEYDLSTEQDCFRGECIDAPVDIPVEALIPHEKYAPTSKSQENDIALIRLSRPVKYTKYIKPICLPGGDRLKALSYDDLDLEVAGWGKTENASFSNVKLKLTIPGMPNSKCSEIYQTRHRIGITNNQLCAGGLLGQDSCRGDSGGPLMYVDRTDPTLPYWYCAGIVSFGPTPCGKEGFPGVYTRVSSYTDWIVKTIKP